MKHWNIYILPVVFCAILALTGGSTVYAQEEFETQQQATTTDEVQEEVALYFFHSPTCPHCRKEQKFLDVMEVQYPDLTVYRYEATDPEHVALQRQLAEDHDAERFLGNVPLTFIGDYHFVGYNSDETTGREIERAIRITFGLEVEENNPTEEETTFDVPILGTIHRSDYSLPALAVLLGFLDGFNVCSLGALVLIIGLSLKLQRRRAIIILGGTFILTTSLVYGGLIVAWYHIFDLFNAYIDFMKVLIALLSLGGGIYFMKEYIRMHKQGAVCELQESKLINTLMVKTGEAFENKTKLLGVIGTVLLFAAVVAIVEFPCSAAVPVVFASMLADAGVSTLSYLSYISIFVLFYMLDEIIIFGIAAYRLKIWMTSGTFTKYAVLAEALILIGIGIFYLGVTVGLL